MGLFGDFSRTGDKQDSFVLLVRHVGDSSYASRSKSAGVEGVQGRQVRRRVGEKARRFGVRPNPKSGAPPFFARSLSFGFASLPTLLLCCVYFPLINATLALMRPKISAFFFFCQTLPTFPTLQLPPKRLAHRLLHALLPFNGVSTSHSYHI